MRVFPFLTAGCFALSTCALAFPLALSQPKKIYGVNLGSWYALTCRSRNLVAEPLAGW